MKFQGMLAAAAVCLAGISLGESAFADLVFTLSDPNQAGTVGSELTFRGSLANVTGPTATIVGDNFSGLPTTLTFDDLPFVLNFLGQDIAGGSTLGPLSFFTVTIDNGAVPGTYHGVISVLFDSDSAMGQETNFQIFSVTVIPEPTPLWLIGSLGTVSLLGARLRRWWAA
jgi:hypothetical protein